MTKTENEDLRMDALRAKHGLPKDLPLEDVAMWAAGEIRALIPVMARVLNEPDAE